MQYYYYYFKSVISVVLLFLNCNEMANARTAWNTEGTEDNSRIVGGTVTTISKAKFIINLRVNGEFICGGTLVAPKYVLTAAHCVEGLKPSKVTVVGGATYLSEQGVKRNIVKIVIPKEYNKRTVNMDIAILELSSIMTGNNISSIALCTSNWKTTDYINVYGWGRITENNKKESNQLRMVSVPFVDQTKCGEMYKGNGKITNLMFCAGDMKGKDACFGDSGGPAIFRNQLCGIVSWGNGCAQKKYPGVYTNIKSVRKFIDKNIIL